MKLAEALVERKAAQTKIGELNERLQRMAVVQQDEQPAEAPADLLRELAEVTNRLEALMVAINLTNTTAACGRRHDLDSRHRPPRCDAHAYGCRGCADPHRQQRASAGAGQRDQAGGDRGRCAIAERPRQVGATISGTGYFDPGRQLVGRSDRGVDLPPARW